MSADMRAVCEALGFDPTNHHNAAKCPYCRPAPQVYLAGHAFELRDLLERVMRNMKGPARFGTPRWVVVKDTFAVGSTVARALCSEFELDPEEFLRKALKS